MFLITVSAVCFFSYFRKMEDADIISNTVLCGLGCFGMLYAWFQAMAIEKLDYDNADNTGRFCVIYLIGLVLAVACAYLPSAGWPFLVVFVALGLFSNTVVGMTAGTLLLAVSVLLGSGGVEVFILYFLCGLIGVSLFRHLDDNYQVGIPIFVSLLFLLTAETAGIVLYTNESLRFTLFQIPLINCLISAVLLLFLLKFFSAIVIYRYRDKYMEINDPEFPLLVKLKDKSKDEYYHGVHTAYFCDRIARRLSLDAEALRTGGYYHRIGLLEGENTWEQVSKVAEEYQFPPAACALLKEYLDKNTPMRKKETAVLMMSDAIVSSICFLFSRNPEGKMDYDQVIETVFKKKLETKQLQDCLISMEEITQMKNLFKEEKLYYDFLR